MMTRDKDGKYTIHSTYEDMRTDIFDSALLENFVFKAHKRKNQLKFKTESEAKICYNYLLNNRFFKERKYTFTLNKKLITFEVGELMKIEFYDILESDPDYVNRKFREDGLDPENLKITEMD